MVVTGSDQPIQVDSAARTGSLHLVVPRRRCLWNGSFHNGRSGSRLPMDARGIVESSYHLGQGTFDASHAMNFAPAAAFIGGRMLRSARSADLPSCFVAGTMVVMAQPIDGRLASATAQRNDLFCAIGGFMIALGFGIRPQRMNERKRRRGKSSAPVSL